MFREIPIRNVGEQVRTDADVILQTPAASIRNHGVPLLLGRWVPDADPGAAFVQPGLHHLARESDDGVPVALVVVVGAASPALADDVVGHIS